MTSAQRQLSHEARERCNQHGLVVVRDGACLLCLKERSRPKRHGVFWAVTALFALGMFLIPQWSVHGRHPSFVAESARSRAPEEVNRTPRMNFNADTARNRRGTPIANLGAESPVSHADPDPDNAEDRCLGAPPVSLPASAVVPPTPPRAPVEDAPLVHDDPADFDLPSARGDAPFLPDFSMQSLHVPGELRPIHERR